MRFLSAKREKVGKACTILTQGGIVAHATETCYGFACDLTNLDAVQRLFTLKKRPVNQPVSALFPSIEEAKKYVEWNDRAEELAQQHLPGPLTLILPLRKGTLLPLFPVPSSHEGTLGVRVSSHPVAQQLVAQFGKPLSTTSANLSGQRSPYSAEEIMEQFHDQQLQPDLILDSGELPRNPPSRVIDLSGESEIVVRG